ncbi:hypothetical protein AX14_003128 [Amanita brunnescens Koide BX004]|nr:hypothetical protein AX14_003128 [Amanita brunnescens Koide BX004]
MLAPLRGHDKEIASVAFSPDGCKIISGSLDKTIRVWDASTGVEMLPPLRGHDGWIISVAFSPDGCKIISGSFDKTIRVWDIGTGVEMLPPLQGYDDWIISVAFSPDGSKIISRSEDGIVRIRDAGTGIMLPPAQILDGNASRDKSMIGGWLTNMNTGRYMGTIPVGASFHCGHLLKDYNGSIVYNNYTRASRLEAVGRRALQQRVDTAMPNDILPHGLSIPIIKKLKDKRIVLASNNPRRKEILRTIVRLQPDVVPSTFEENLSLSEFEDIQEYPVLTAMHKAVEVYERMVTDDPDNTPDLVIAADTVTVVLTQPQASTLCGDQEVDVKQELLEKPAPLTRRTTCACC